MGRRNVLVVLFGAVLAGGAVAGLGVTALAAGVSGACPAWVPAPAGTSAAATTTSSTEAPASAPAVAVTLGTTLVGSNAALVAASVGDSGTGQATVAYWETGGAVGCSPAQTVGADALKLVVTGLQPATQYEFEVVADTGAGAVVSPTATLSTLPQGTISQGVAAGPTRLGRLTRAAASARLLKAANVPLRFAYHGALWHVTPTQLGVRILVGRTLAAALKAEPGTGIAEPAIRVDGARLRRYVATLAAKYGHPAAAAAVRLNGSHAEITTPAPGAVLEQNALVGAIEHQLDHGLRTRLELPMRTSRPPQATQTKAVVVRLDTQTLTAYLNGKAILTTPVTTGRPALPTPVGSFSVQFKASPYVFHSPWAPGSPYWYPPAPVTWAMEFYDGDFLHDDPAEPSSAFGSDSQDGYFASHGCVHVPHDAMAFLYGWLPVGAPVIVARD